MTLDRSVPEPNLDDDGVLIAGGGCVSGLSSRRYVILVHGGLFHAYLSAWGTVIPPVQELVWAGGTTDPHDIHEWMISNDLRTKDNRDTLLKAMIRLSAEGMFESDADEIPAAADDEIGTSTLDDADQAQYLIDTLRAMCDRPVDVTGLQITVHLTTPSGLTAYVNGHYDPQTKAIYICGDAHPVVMTY